MRSSAKEWAARDSCHLHFSEARPGVLSDSRWLDEGVSFRFQSAGNWSFEDVSYPGSSVLPFSLLGSLHQGQPSILRKLVFSVTRLIKIHLGDSPISKGFL